MISDDSGFTRLFTKIERERGFRGNLYRQRCLRRRLAVRMRARGVSTLAEYSALLDADPGEYERLLRVLTINVSKFFRNPKTWDVVSGVLLPDLLSRDSALTFWSAGSAAGEEAYSLAIIAWELARKQGRGWKGIRIIGTDIDSACLAAARTAAYPAVAVSDAPATIRQRWFDENELFRLRQPIPSLVEFRQLDLLEGRPDFNADLVLCRNLLIYLDRPAQRKAFEVFADVLNPGGYLVLGRVEMLGSRIRSHFEIVDARERVFRKL